MAPADDKRSISRSHLLGDEHSQGVGLDSEMEMGAIAESNAAAGVTNMSPSESLDRGCRGLNRAPSSNDPQLMDGGVACIDGEAGLDAVCAATSESNGVLDSIPVQNRVDVRFSGVSTWVSATFMPPSTLAVLWQKLLPQSDGPEQSHDSKRQVGPSNCACRSAIFLLFIKLLEYPRCCRSAMVRWARGPLRSRRYYTVRQLAGL